MFGVFSCFERIVFMLVFIKDEIYLDDYFFGFVFFFVRESLMCLNFDYEVRVEFNVERSVG